MDAAKEAQIAAHVQALAELLYEESAATHPEQLSTLEGIEVAVREHLQQRVSPSVANFLSQKSSGTTAGRRRHITSILGELTITEQQAKRLQLKSHSRWSPYLEKCCLLVSANSSSERSAEDLAVLTGIRVSGSTQQRLVHRQSFELPAVDKAVDNVIEEMSVDGGKVRLRTPVGEPCQWRDYKAANLAGLLVGAFYQENQGLCDWVNDQPLSLPLVCLGDGHDGIWNIYREIATDEGRLEILDWFHLVENMAKVGGSQQRLNRVEALLWKGDVDRAIAQFDSWQNEQVTRFIGYLNKHRDRIVNYGYYQQEGDFHRVGCYCIDGQADWSQGQDFGAQWNEQNVPQVLKHRCAYLNGAFSA